MILHTFIVFILLFILPTTYQRLKFILKPHLFYTTRIRKKTGLQIHHAHWGLLCILVSSMYLVFADKNMWVIALAGLGWGLLFDEIIPHLKMPSDDRKLELDIYARATRPTIILIGVMVCIFTTIFVFTHY